MKKNSLIYIAGHRGLVGSAIVRKLRSEGFENLLALTHSELDLCDAAAVSAFFGKEKPEYVFDAAAKVGGILANRDFPADFLLQNLSIQNSILAAAHESGVKKLLFLGSSCIYPRLAPQPIREESLLSGPLEETNRAYAVAKIAGIELCRAFRRQHGSDFISAIPTNLYGPNDNFDLQLSHVLPGLIRKFHEAKMNGTQKVTLWGTGSPMREFLHVDDLAAACLFLMENWNGEEPINVGTGEDISIRQLAEMIQKETGYSGTIEWDSSKPDGTPRKLLDVSRLNELGWKYSIPLEKGIRETYRWYADSLAKK